MKILKEIHLKTKDGNRIVYFGTADNNQELQEIFRQRYEVYSELNYISKNFFPSKIEKDEYDNAKKCDYFIAKFDNQLIGSARVIYDYYLPTEKDCFEFKEPTEMKKIPKDQRGEISRLIVIRLHNGFLPPHLLILGIFYSIVKIASKRNKMGGYSFIKESLRNKLKKIGIPFHIIKPYKQIYSKKYLWGYFHNSTDPAVPIYYLKDEAKEYLNKIFNNKKIFKKLDDIKFLYLLDKHWKFLFYIKLSRLINFQ